MVMCKQRMWFQFEFQAATETFTPNPLSEQFLKHVRSPERCLRLPAAPEVLCVPQPFCSFDLDSQSSQNLPPGKVCDVSDIILYFY